MNIHFLFENGQGSVVDEYGRPEPMDYIVDEEQFRLEFSYTIFSSDASGDLSAAATATQLGIHVRTGQKWAKQYEKDPGSIFEKRRETGRPRILHEEHKNTILECIDENPSVVLDEIMKKLKQIFTELKVSKSTLFDFVKKNIAICPSKKLDFNPYVVSSIQHSIIHNDSIMR
ncbi:hypothetical protein EDC96DRAFT_565916 [Choanephora cucurbitarum]|nr:hypothetical protein EDC96DRAFT_565916 [Choanephora cucurbitarum]